MFAHQKKLAKALVLTSFLVSPATLMAGGLGDNGVRDSAVANTARTQALVPCPRLDRNVPASLAAEMDCGQATPRVAGERVRNTGGGLFGGHDVGSAPPANSDNDEPFKVTRDRAPTDDGDGPSDNDGGPVDDGGTPTDNGETPTDDGETPTDDGETPTDDGETPTDGGGPVDKWDRLSELGVDASNLDEQSDSFREQLDEYGADPDLKQDWSGFNPTE